MRQANKMSRHLVDLERRALDFRNSGHIEEATELFSAIIKEQPDWEHGTGFYNLACCYEDLGRLDLAEECYNAALRFEPANPYFLGGLASFLYLHGEPEKAFNSYLILLEVDRMNNDEKGAELSTTALKAIGRKWASPRSRLPKGSTRYSLEYSGRAIFGSDSEGKCQR